MQIVPDGEHHGRLRHPLAEPVQQFEVVDGGQVGILRKHHDGDRPVSRHGGRQRLGQRCLPLHAGRDVDVAGLKRRDRVGHPARVGCGGADHPHLRSC
ncbi:hypothetical protein [Microbacterium sp. Se5.02b]|uniref:hypothetical protein n=1 Tax=Microbacterium sp. Se5.02b TaxID=2864103 RepID=UPI001C68771F|nr:hypothetical protein [Microbacterium sp. Se5.02b]QYM64417.1 hypothetical protein K1X59_00275 [Microbacterium sp. Se5.02b]